MENCKENMHIDDGCRGLRGEDRDSSSSHRVLISFAAVLAPKKECDEDDGLV